MSIISSILGGGIKTVASSIETVAGIFGANKEKKSIRDSDNDISVRQQYQSEFNVHKNRTWFDSLVDGLNRLVRPVLAYNVIAFFYLAVINPKLMLSVTQSLSLVPEMMWVLLSIIVTFYFGGRHLEKKAEIMVSKEAINRYRDIDSVKNELSYQKSIKDESMPLTDEYIIEWNNRNKKK